MTATVTGVDEEISFGEFIGTEKAKKIVDTFSNAIPDIASKLKNTVSGSED